MVVIIVVVIVIIIIRGMGGVGAVLLPGRRLLGQRVHQLSFGFPHLLLFPQQPLLALLLVLLLEPNLC